MASRSRIQPLARDLQVIIDQDLSPEAQGRALAAFAKTTLKETQDQNRRALGRTPPHKTFVDGSEGRSLDTVKPTSRITFEFELMGDVVGFVLEQLRKHSPVLTGAYREAHIVFVDGKQVEAVAEGETFDEVVILNPLPYSRRIERGSSPAASDGVYQVVAALAQSRFGNLARVTFSFRTPLGTQTNISRVGPLQVQRSAKAGSRGRFLKGSHTRAGNQEERAQRVPAIIITPRS